MKYPDNIRDVAALSPDFMGFIFYEKSPRYLSKIEVNIPKSITKVGVFVAQDVDYISQVAKQNSIDFIQLHGDIPVIEIEKLKAQDFTIIKAIGVGDTFDPKKLSIYKEVADYFLFDTQTTAYGGSGKKFNWEVLKPYQMPQPFFLAGGLGVDDIEDVLALGENLPIYALDMNSALEDAPALKSIEKVKIAIEKVRILKFL